MNLMLGFRKYLDFQGVTGCHIKVGKLRGCKRKKVKCDSDDITTVSECTNDILDEYKIHYQDYKAIGDFEKGLDPLLSIINPR